jgi:hypothetical protein
MGVAGIQEDRMITITRWLLASTVLLGACTADDDPGSGSGTLYVRATVTAVSELPDERDPGNYIAQYRATVWAVDQRELAVESVTVTSPAGAVDLTRSADGGWWGEQYGYHQTYTLDIEAGDDYLSGARLVGPDLHTIESPTQAGTVSGSQDLNVAWARDQVADYAQVSTARLDATGTDDVGEFVVPMEMLNIDQQSNQDRVHVRRGNLLRPAGAAPDSTFSVDIDSHVSFSIAP